MIDCSNDSIFSWTDSWLCKCGSSGGRVGYCSSCGGVGSSSSCKNSVVYVFLVIVSYLL